LDFICTKQSMRAFFHLNLNFIILQMPKIVMCWLIFHFVFLFSWFHLQLFSIIKLMFPLLNFIQRLDFINNFALIFRFFNLISEFFLQLFLYQSLVALFRYLFHCFKMSLLFLKIILQLIFQSAGQVEALFFLDFLYFCLDILLQIHW